MSTAARTEHLVPVATLRDALSSARPPVLLDVRWHLSDTPGAARRRFEDGHLPGARFLDLEAVLTRHPDDPRDGRHPLPEADTLAAGLAYLGVHADSEVVVYDEPGSFAAERAWWVLRWAGLRARVLDGGLTAWADAGMPVEPGPGGPGDRPGDGLVAQASRLALTTGHLPTVDTDGAAAFPDSGILVDARAGERYRGEVEPLDPRAGRIPGAVNAPASALFTDEGGLPGDDDLRALLGNAAAGAAPVAVYCGSGVSAARDLLALAVLDVDAALFPGSWSAWSNDPARPIATGP